MEVIEAGGTEPSKVARQASTASSMADDKVRDAVLLFCCWCFYRAADDEYAAPSCGSCKTYDKALGMIRSSTAAVVISNHRHRFTAVRRLSHVRNIFVLLFLHLRKYVPDSWYVFSFLCSFLYFTYALTFFALLISGRE